MGTSDVKFFVTHSAKCAWSVSFETMYPSPFPIGGSLNPLSFPFNLKFASMERNWVFNQLGKVIIQLGPQGERVGGVNLPVRGGSDQVFLRMGTRRAFDCGGSGGKGAGSTNVMGPTPTTDLSQVGPDARHQGKFIIAVLGDCY